MMTRKRSKATLLYILLAALAIILIIVKRESFSSFIALTSHILRPVLIGLVLAYLCNPIFRLFERKLLARIHSFSFRRTLSLIGTYIVLALIFIVLLMLIIPQLITSVLDFLNNYETLLTTAMENINSIIDQLNDLMELEIPHIKPESLQFAMNWIVENVDIQGYMDRLLTISNLTILISKLEETFLVITDTIFGLFISLYLLASKERLYAQLMRTRHAWFNDRINERITNVCTVADKSFGGFLRGKMLDSTIVGVLVYIIISLMNVPYALLIAVLIGITDIVPVIGPFVGVIPSAIIILLTDPIKVIPFLLCILIVQQIDGNIIAPKILGENTGVSSLCVMISITVMGAIWGLAGMVLGVPLFATIIELTNEFLNKRLRAKGLPVNTQVDEEPTKKKKAQPLNLAEGSGLLSANEKELLLAFRLAKKHELFLQPSFEACTACAAEYAAATKAPLSCDEAAEAGSSADPQPTEGITEAGA